MRLQRIRDGTLGRPPGAPAPTNSTNGASPTKKRKADGEESHTRKKTKGSNKLPEGFFDDNATSESGESPEDEASESKDHAAAQAMSKPVQQDANTTATSKAVPGQPSINEDEWAAFERDVATPPPEPAARSALVADATISAAPLTAAEVAARTKEAENAQARERREAELEGEKEDAARQLEEEFDEMEELEGRVRRLREKREELRKRREEGAVPETRVMASEEVLGNEGDSADEEDNDGEDGDEWDDWGLR